MNLFTRDPERHVAGRTPMIKRTTAPSPTSKAVSAGYRKRVTQGVQNANFARHGLKKLFGA